MLDDDLTIADREDKPLLVHTDVVITEPDFVAGTAFKILTDVTLD